MPGSSPGGGGKLSNVFDKVTNPSQPSGDPDQYIKFNANTDFTGWGACFAKYIQPTQAYEMWAGQRPIALGAFTDPSGTLAWAPIPSWAVIGPDDNAIPPAERTFMAQRVHSQIIYVTAGHLSMISKPGVVTKIITEGARAEGLHQARQKPPNQGGLVRRRRTTISPHPASPAIQFGALDITEQDGEPGKAAGGRAAAVNHVVERQDATKLRTAEPRPRY
jgi:hypothetical protein